jgi:rod shape-determining protein MreC
VAGVTELLNGTENPTYAAHTGLYHTFQGIPDAVGTHRYQFFTDESRQCCRTTRFPYRSGRWYRSYSLSREVARTRKAMIENDNLRAMLDLKKNTQQTLIIAEVVGKITAEMRGYLTLNKGEQQGVKAGMAVQTDRGLAGHVLATSDNYSLVQMILNRDTRIAVKVERTRIDGIIVWEGGEYLLLKNIAKTQDIRAGDMIVTSGFSSMFPSDVYVGRITDVSDEPNSLFRRITVTPMVNFSTLEQVFVNTKKPTPEREELEEIVAKKLQSK